MWIIVHHRGEGDFASEEEAVARAWELTPPGEKRPRVIPKESTLKVPASAGTHTGGGNAHLHVTFDGRQFAGSLDASRSVFASRDGKFAELRTMRTFHRLAGMDNQRIREICEQDLWSQARAQGLSFVPDMITWRVENLVDIVRITAEVTARELA